MPDGACVVRYDGKRGTVWRVKFRERPSVEFPDGRQVTETLGRADEGWTKRRAEAALRARLTDVERVGLKRPGPTTFAAFAARWLEEYPAAAAIGPHPLLPRPPTTTHRQRRNDSKQHT